MKDINYYFDFNNSGGTLFDYELRQSFAVMQRLGQIAQKFRQNELAKQVNEFFQEMQLAE